MSDVLRWAVDQYRNKLLEVDRDACYRIDMVMVRAGQSWVSDSTVIDPDELVTAGDVEARFGIREFNVRALARRYGVNARGKRGLSNLYRLGDILSAQAAKKSFNKLRK